MYLTANPYQIPLSSEEYACLSSQLAAIQRIIETSTCHTHEQRLLRDDNLKHIKTIRERLYKAVPNIFYSPFNY